MSIINIYYVADFLAPNVFSCLNKKQQEMGLRFISPRSEQIVVTGCLFHIILCTLKDL